MNKSAAEVEQEVEASRGQLDRTVEALKDKMSPGQLFDEFSSSLGGAGDKILSKFLDQAMENPMPLAVMGVGLAWLMMGKTGGGVPAGDYGYQNPASPTLGARRSNGAGHASVVDKVTDTAQSAAAAVGDVAASAKDKVTHLAADASDSLSSLGDKVGSTTAAAADKAAQYGAKARDTAMSMLHDEPLLAGAIGLAIGIALGAALPATDVEDRYVGPLRDKVVDKTMDVADDQLHAARDMATAAYGSVKDEIEHQVGPEGHQSLAEKAGEIARAGVQAVQDTIRDHSGG